MKHCITRTTTAEKKKIKRMRAKVRRARALFEAAYDTPQKRLVQGIFSASTAAALDHNKQWNGAMNSIHPEAIFRHF